MSALRFVKPDVIFIATRGCVRMPIKLNKSASPKCFAIGILSQVRGPESSDGLRVQLRKLVAKGGKSDYHSFFFVC
jgi:hypothetical protein